ncbi:beta-glucosidase 47-like [Olea europaea var. sylvestris]|uniref:Beta-glucosidase 46-like isoform X1 n=1 Tax=Olea europaea subsp. europaea TaxID=158383 RepID=A0A8S0T3F7_OLEEU|nr:beta-glucosidase 47-like [Olea europaea var. sylvestris]CAA2998276.1 beta-glucosidase 46-like isoform X1 [Olea europaea subsp. europaea]
MYCIHNKIFLKGGNKIRMITVCDENNKQVDIDLMENLGVNSFRFSISWSRILPKGGYGNVNIAGINHYNDLIDRLLHKGIQPFVTLCHYDIPQELEERYGSWLSPEIQNEFEYYADVCFKYFGDRVKYWITINEPNIMAIRGYRTGIYPPSRCSVSFRHCREGDSEKEPLIAAHNMILSHAAAVSIYRTKYQNVQGGSIGIVMNAVWFEPFSDSAEDKSAAERTLSFYMNWFLDPIIHGKYPEEMHNILGSLLPVFVEKELEKLKFGLDFIGINHYTSFYSKDCIYSECGGGLGVSKSEGHSLWTPWKDGKLIGKSTAVDWLYVYPQGMEKIVTYIKDRYNNTPMFICENGLGDANNLDTSVAESLNDVERVEYMENHLDSLAKAIRNGADVRGYFAWSLLDNFEWTSGYTIRFGLHHVDYASLERIPRLSATWYKDFVSDVRGLQKW